MCMTLLSRGSTARLAHLGQFNGGKTAEVCGISFKITDSTRTSATFMHRNFRGVPDACHSSDTPFSHWNSVSLLYFACLKGIFVRDTWNIIENGVSRTEKPEKKSREQIQKKALRRKPYESSWGRWLVILCFFTLNCWCLGCKHTLCYAPAHNMKQR